MNDIKKALSKIKDKIKIDSKTIEATLNIPISLSKLFELKDKVDIANVDVDVIDNTVQVFIETKDNEQAKILAQFLTEFIEKYLKDWL